VETFFHLDAKIPRTLRALAVTPGALTRSYFAGRRKPFVSPFLVFFWASLLFYFAQSLTGLVLFSPPLRVYINDHPAAHALIDGRMEIKHLSAEDFAERFNHTSSAASKSLVIIMALLFSIALWILFAFRRRFLIEHVVFALHTYSFWIFWLCLVLIAARLLTLVDPGLRLTSFTDNILTAFEFGGLAVYLFLALRRFYSDSRAASAVRAILLTVAAYCIMLTYRWFLFIVGAYLS
jgi:hypothetical protein